MKTINNSGRKESRIVARVDDATQQFISAAAELSGMSVSQFLIDAARERAQVVTEQMTKIHVSLDTSNRMLEALDRPVSLSASTIAKVKRYKDVINENRNNHETA
ncbi:hypothetical protein ABA45_02135 [Marinobacter psychrophilus]|uniref:DUF1778 domain-containing protein n=1 Tax=Marinobacter psychrophilus TaxID=330734 RepID=A0A0H4HXI2_9GAMM|nr:DUF1778 domain-containing protein [Marinobacter psychrophilus]AKO51366.1 hypothetical protein ABA45_02135 [Marinobacter psychrophilus]